MSYKILRELVEVYSPSGCEDSVQKVLYKIIRLVITICSW